VKKTFTMAIVQCWYIDVLSPKRLSTTTTFLVTKSK